MSAKPGRGARLGPCGGPKSARFRRWVMIENAGTGRDGTGSTTGQLKRRGLIAAAAALVAGALAKASERLAQAADGGNFILGQNNSTASETKITRNLGTTAGVVAFGVDNTLKG